MIKKQINLQSLKIKLRTLSFLCFFAGTLWSGTLSANAVNLVNKDEQIDNKITIKGIVTDVKGEPIIGASIVEKGNPSVGTITNLDGSFTLKVVPKTVLLVSYIGYKTIDVALEGQNYLKIVLEEDTKLLNEVVVVGYGIQKKASVTGSVSAINSKTLTTIKTSDVSNMLAGRLPGLRAMQTSGAPGDDEAKVDIRGYGNMLVIVDGVERSYSQLDPNDIESISILKDAAAAVYGFKGSNGVLLVTTKRGKVSKPKIEYNAYYGLQKVTRYPEMLSAYEYAVLYNEAVYNNDIWGAVPTYSPNQLAAFKNGSAGTNWWKATMRDYAPQSSNTLSITGGTEKVKYYISSGYLNQGGILKSGDWNYKRYDVRSNIDIEAAKGLKINLSLSGRYDKREKPYGADDLFRSAQMAIPTYSIYANNNADYWQAVGDKPNPVHVSYADNVGYEDRETRNFNGSMGFSWDLPGIKGLMLKGTIAYDYYNKEWKNWRKDLSEYTYNSSTDEYSEKIINTANLGTTLENYDKPTYQISLNYSKTLLEKHDISALLLWEAYNDTQRALTANSDFDMGLIPEYDYASSTNPTTGNTIKTAHEGLVGRINYAYSNKYLAELNFRYDGSYKFHTGNRWGFFPGLSLGWRLSEEPFFKGLIPLCCNPNILS